MKTQFKTIVLAVLTSSMIFSGYAQINLLSDDINFRGFNNAGHSTYHYGDLHLEGGSTGTGWGWLYSNRINCYGDLNVTGTKNFIQPHPTDSTKIIKYIAIESGEALTVARGTAKTVNGQAIIALPEHFSLVTSSAAPVTVLLTPEKVPVLLYTKEKSKEKIVVAMKSSEFSDFGDAEFAFQVTGVRDGFENEAAIIDADKLNAEPDQKAVKNPVKKRISAMIEKIKAKTVTKKQK